MSDKPKNKKMECRTVLIWSLVNNKHHKQLTEREQQILGVMPLIKKLFPGINYYSITGFGQVMVRCVVPVLKKMFPELLKKTEDEITPQMKTKIATFLHSDGYEWQDSSKWMLEFNKLLAAN